MVVLSGLLIVKNDTTLATWQVMSQVRQLERQVKDITTNVSTLDQNLKDHIQKWLYYLQRTTTRLDKRIDNLTTEVKRLSGASDGESGEKVYFPIRLPPSGK